MKPQTFNVGDLVTIRWNYTYHGHEETLGVVVGSGNNAALVSLHKTNGRSQWISKEYLEIVSASR